MVRTISTENNKIVAGTGNVCFALLVVLLLFGCAKEQDNLSWEECNYSGTYRNVSYTESLVKSFAEGIYYEKDIPEDIQQIAYGRIEIDFRYNGGGANYFAPLFYYGSINKNNNDNVVEEPKFHMAIEIGHYNVIPVPVEYLFYTICTNNRPRYCRDTDFPIIHGTDYTIVIDKKPEGIIIQLKKGDHIVNIFPHAFFPDSTQMFFKDITNYTEKNKGDSLQKVLMVGHGFAGIEKGLHDLNGHISQVRIFKYTISGSSAGYELQRVRNQHNEMQQVNYRIIDHLNDANKSIIITNEFWPYKYESGELIPNGEKKTRQPRHIINNNQLQIYQIQTKDIGLYKVHLQTLDENGSVISSTGQPFEVWVYPEAWNFEFY